VSRILSLNESVVPELLEDARFLCDKGALASRGSERHAVKLRWVRRRMWELSYLKNAQEIQEATQLWV